MRQLTGLAGPRVNTLNCFRSRPERSLTWPVTRPTATQLMETPSSSLEKVTALTLSPTSQLVTGVRLMEKRNTEVSAATAMSPDLPDIAENTGPCSLESTVTLWRKCWLCRSQVLTLR